MRPRSKRADPSRLLPAAVLRSVLLYQASLRSLVLIGTHITGTDTPGKRTGSSLLAERLVVDGDVVLTTGFSAVGAICLRGAYIAGMFAMRVSQPWQEIAAIYDRNGQTGRCPVDALQAALRSTGNAKSRWSRAVAKSTEPPLATGIPPRALVWVLAIFTLALGVTATEQDRFTTATTATIREDLNTCTRVASGHRCWARCAWLGTVTLSLRPQAMTIPPWVPAGAPSLGRSLRQGPQGLVEGRGVVEPAQFTQHQIVRELPRL